MYFFVSSLPDLIKYWVYFLVRVFSTFWLHCVRIYIRNSHYNPNQEGKHYYCGNSATVESAFLNKNFDYFCSSKCLQFYYSRTPVTRNRITRTIPLTRTNFHFPCTTSSHFYSTSSKTPLTRTVFRFPSEFELPGFNYIFETLFPLSPPFFRRIK